MSGLMHDLRYGLRMLVWNRSFTAVVILTLAIGIGANTAIFSIVNAVVLRPLPYERPDRLAMLWTDDTKRGLHEQVTSYLTYSEWRAQNQSFADMAIFTGNPLVLTGEDRFEQVKGAFVSANLFPLLGVKPALGDVISAEEEERGEAVAVLSYGLWQRRFGGSPDAIGKTLTIDGDSNSRKQGPRTVRVLGAMPAGFNFPDKETDLWEPSTVYWRWKSESTDRFHIRWCVVGRLKPGATITKAQAEMTAIGERFTSAYQSPYGDFPGFAVNVVPLLDQVLGKNLKLALWVLLSAVGFVLLIACVNVANLLLARGAAREREFAIRAALGAGRGRLLRQLLIESMLLAAVAGLIGVWLASWGIDALIALAPPGIPRLDQVRIDKVVLLFSASASVLAGILFGLGPAWRMSRSNPGEILKEGGSVSGGLRLRQTRGFLVVLECALAVVLLTGAGLMLSSFLRLRAVDPGFNPQGVLLVSFALPPSVGKLDAESIFAGEEETLNQITERVAAVPGVQSASSISSFLIQGDPDRSITIEGRPPMRQEGGAGQLANQAVGTDFFKTMGVPLRRGRFFTRSDAVAKVHLLFNNRNTRDNAEAAIINESFVRRFFPDEDPVGKRFYIGELTRKHYWYEIVGIVGDMHRQGLDKEPIPEYFLPFFDTGADLVVRSNSDPLALATSVREAIRSVDKNAMFVKVTTVDSLLGDLSADRRFQAWLLGVFAAGALALATVGIYGIMHYAVTQRTREIGIRMALGAAGSQVMRLVIGQGLKLVLAGLMLGLLAAWWLTGVLAHLLFEVNAHDPMTFAGVALLLIAVALAACYLPARRASKVDPMEALRYE